MKNLIALLVFGALGLSACRKNNSLPGGGSSTSTPLTAQEKDDLSFLIEEEKLARDVYLYSYNEYGMNIFNNISSSEQSHMNSVENLLNKYGLTNPVQGLAPGVFVTPAMQQLYYDLTTKADSSLLDALEVGATIEDLDIYDIKHLEANTTKTDLLNVYSQLTCGSYNHLRSYYGKILDNSGSYTPQYITQAEFDAIVNSAKTQCN